jgi:D-arabinose 1-dehydrogenase-like Zn-dependent alcohol dehydrogenase
MKAAVFNTPGEPLQIQEVDKPSIAPDEMRYLRN